MKHRKPHKRKRIFILSKEYVVELSPLVEIEGFFFSLSCTAVTKVSILHHDFKYSAEHISIMEIKQTSL